jgi:hypothetical protein
MHRKEIDRRQVLLIVHNSLLTTGGTATLLIDEPDRLCNLTPTGSNFEATSPTCQEPNSNDEEGYCDTRLSLSFVSFCMAVRGMHWASIPLTAGGHIQNSFDLRLRLLEVAVQGASTHLADRLLLVVV